ncbi:hypothetical protein HPB48_018020 [Haemaphysalis longicornis]|uniref:Uncharacterized protein n=1 Tax=Haemaphysalis longicornis TaxID=44386 RepID=A0A9J6FIW2_HAELO|nr:hypothetical protein HPB48_018020 [Haemaphysalis longicornis]
MPAHGLQERKHGRQPDARTVHQILLDLRGARYRAKIHSAETGSDFRGLFLCFTEKLCTNEESKAALEECSGIISAKILQNINVQSRVQLRNSCEYVTKYQDCMARRSYEICPLERTVTREWLQNATDGLFSKYFWVCEPQKISCTVEKLAEVIDSCEDHIHSYVIPYSANHTDKRSMKFACQGNKKYQDCIIYHSNSLCPEVVFDADLLNKVTKNMFTKYNWTCSENGKGGLIRLAHSPANTESYVAGTHCSFKAMSSGIEQCSSIISSQVIPLLDESNDEVLPAACRGLHDYRTCAYTGIMESCSPTTATIANSSAVNEYFNQVMARHSSVCSEDIEPECTEKALADKLRRCKGIITWVVLPNTENPDDDEQQQRACAALNMYQECVNEEIVSNCVSNQGQVLLLDAVKNYTYSVYEQYQWTCDHHPDCTKYNLLNDLNSCKGIITTKVIPNAGNISETSKLAEACRGTRLYQECVEKKMSAKCAEDSPGVPPS